MPGSETILTLDEDVASNTFITTACLLERTDGSQLYIGSSKGLLIVAHANGMQPISACRPFAGELVSLCVVEGSVKDDDGSIKCSFIPSIPNLSFQLKVISRRRRPRVDSAGSGTESARRSRGSAPARRSMPIHRLLWPVLVKVLGQSREPLDISLFSEVFLIVS